MSIKTSIKACPLCDSGFILSSDLHAICEGCLGASHARLAMDPHSSCPACALLTTEEKQCQFNLFPSAEEECQPREYVSYDLFEELTAHIFLFGDG